MNLPTMGAVIIKDLEMEDQAVYVVKGGKVEKVEPPDAG
jgi:hypothetical protein